MLNGYPVTDLIEKRYSCRTFAPVPISQQAQRQLTIFLRAHTTGPFGSSVRLSVIASTDEDSHALKGLGTYGFIKNPAGYIVAAMHKAPALNLEDLGWVLEQNILYATSLGLGTVWLGGTFTKGRFAQVMNLRVVEEVPAVIAMGYPEDVTRAWDQLIRRQANANQRLPWQQLFFEAHVTGGSIFDVPLTEDRAGRYAKVLDMVRRGPSASNKQPWRVVRDGQRWHFYLQRTKGYLSRNALVGVADMQRIDMGIAMCHWQLTAKELGLGGHWKVAEPDLQKPNRLTSYTVSWVPG